VTYTNLAQDEKISDGDYITIKFVHSGSESITYQVSMVSIPYGVEFDKVTFY
jgi:hypothetical protein